MTFFLNLEPSTLDFPCPADLVPTVDEAREGLRVVVEMGERSLLDDPAGLLGSVASVRDDGWGVAVDRVGGDHSALAMLPFVQPDVIKVNLPLLQVRVGEQTGPRRPTRYARHSERTGAGTLVQGSRDRQRRHVGQDLRRQLRPGLAVWPPEALPAEVKAPYEPFPLMQEPESARPAHALRAHHRTA